MKMKVIQPKKPKAKRDKKTAKARLASIIMNGPITIWSILFIIVPVVVLAVMSFMQKGPLGIIVYKPTLANYRNIFSSMYLNVIRQSLIIAFWTTLLTVFIGYPFASIMAKMKAKTSNLFMILLMMKKI